MAPARSLEEIYRTYAQSTVVVLPLVNNLHASECTVALEAQRFGWPLVTTDVGGLNGYLGPSGVYLYAVCDAHALAGGLRSPSRPPRTEPC